MTTLWDSFYPEHLSEVTKHTASDMTNDCVQWRKWQSSQTGIKLTQNQSSSSFKTWNMERDLTGCRGGEEGKKQGNKTVGSFVSLK